MKPRTRREQRLLKEAFVLLEDAMGDEMSYGGDDKGRQASAQRNTDDGDGVPDNQGMIRANAGSMGQNMAEMIIRKMCGEVGPDLIIDQAGIGASGTPDIAIAGIGSRGNWEHEALTTAISAPSHGSNDFPAYGETEFCAVEVKFGDATIDVGGKDDDLMFSVQHEDGFMFLSGGGPSAAFKLTAFSDGSNGGWLDKFLKACGADSSLYNTSKQQDWCTAQATNSGFSATDTFDGVKPTRYKLFPSGHAHAGELAPKKRKKRWEITVKYKSDPASGANFGAGTEAEGGNAAVPGLGMDTVAPYLQSIIKTLAAESQKVRTETLQDAQNNIDSIEDAQWTFSVLGHSAFPVFSSKGEPLKIYPWLTDIADGLEEAIRNRDGYFNNRGAETGGRILDALFGMDVRDEEVSKSDAWTALQEAADNGKILQWPKTFKGSSKKVTDFKNLLKGNTVKKQVSMEALEYYLKNWSALSKAITEFHEGPFVLGSGPKAYLKQIAGAAVEYIQEVRDEAAESAAAKQLFYDLIVQKCNGGWGDAVKARLGKVRTIDELLPLCDNPDGDEAQQLRDEINAGTNPWIQLDPTKSEAENLRPWTDGLFSSADGTTEDTAPPSGTGSKPDAEDQANANPDPNAENVISQTDSDDGFDAGDATELDDIDPTEASIEDAKEELSRQEEEEAPPEVKTKLEQLKGALSDDVVGAIDDMFSSLGTGERLKAARKLGLKTEKGYYTSSKERFSEFIGKITSLEDEADVLVWCTLMRDALEKVDQLSLLPPKVIEILNQTNESRRFFMNNMILERFFTQAQLEILFEDAGEDMLSKLGFTQDVMDKIVTAVGEKLPEEAEDGEPPEETIDEGRWLKLAGLLKG